ncbi:MAG: hypothetical protein KBA55_10775 [Ruminococcus sp.]|nr:hypothetical protein [Ruminococcus sp.]
MAKRGSNIYKRKDGRFEGRVHVGYKADGSKKYRSVYGKTLAEVKEKMADLYSVRTEKNISAIRLTVREAADQWLSAARLRVKESSYTVRCIERYYPNLLDSFIIMIYTIYYNNDLDDRIYIDSAVKEYINSEK